MDFFTSGLFWGTILVLIGLSIILKVVFDINIPVVRILFACLLIFWGVKLIMGISFKKERSSTVVFSEENVKYDKEKKEYNTIFGKATIDLSDMTGQDTLSKTAINVIFGSADILINDARPVRIKASSAFGAINFPDETVISFGDRIYKTSAYKENQAYTEVELNVVFGSANIRRVGSY